jgi:hypothetical protein
MKKVIIVMCLIVFAGSLSGCGKDDDNKKDSGSKEEVSEVVKKKEGTSIYLIALNEANLASNDGLSDAPINNCESKLIEVSLGKELSPQEILNQLLSYEKYDKEKGTFNAFAVSNNLKVENLLVKNDFAVVTLSEGLAPGEPCSDMQLYAQIRKTLLQFDEIKGVDVFVGKEELSSYLMRLRDRDTNNPK